MTRSDSLNDREFFDYVCSRIRWAAGVSRRIVGVATDCRAGLTVPGCGHAPVPGGNLE